MCEGVRKLGDTMQYSSRARVRTEAVRHISYTRARARGGREFQAPCNVMHSPHFSLVVALSVTVPGKLGPNTTHEH